MFNKIILLNYMPCAKALGNHSSEGIAMKHKGAKLHQRRVKLPCILSARDITILYPEGRYHGWY